MKVQEKNYYIIIKESALLRYSSGKACRNSDYRVSGILAMLVFLHDPCICCNLMILQMGLMVFRNIATTTSTIIETWTLQHVNTLSMFLNIFTFADTVLWNGSSDTNGHLNVLYLIKYGMIWTTLISHEKTKLYQKMFWEKKTYKVH